MTADVRKKEFHPNTNSDCLICSGQIKVSKRNCFGIFDNHVTKSSGSPLYTLIARVLEVEIREDSVHSNVICKLCLKMLNEVDDMEVRIQELKQKINASYQESIKMLNEVNINPPEESHVSESDDRKLSVEFLPTAREESIKYETHNSRDEAFNINGNAAEESEIQEPSSGGVPDSLSRDDMQETANGECSDDLQEPAEANGDCSDDMEEMGVAGDDPDYVPNPVVDTDMKPLTIPREISFLKKSSPNECIPDKLVERDGIYFVCLLCSDDKIMGDRKGIVCHLKAVHGIRVFICEICLECFKRRNDLSEHLDSHVATEEGEFCCEVCSRLFNNVRQFEVHRRVHFPQEKLWTCDLCSKSYHSRNMLEEHKNIHIGLRPYICEECGKSFTSKYSHQAHKKIHENRERSFSCSQCGKAFYRATSLTQHLRTHTEMRNYVCEQCGKGFITARYLEVHTITHTGYRPFVCRTCGKDFARRAEMVNHERTHTGERPYQCEFCGATFSQRSNLQSHKRATHYQDKRYKCTLCDKGFKRQRLLDYHIKAAHTGERPYKCQSCSAAFIYPHHFKKHKRMHMAKV